MQIGELAPSYRVGRSITASGYVLVLAPAGHPRAQAVGKSGHGYVREHILVMEEVVGRYLDAEETVHHKNGIKDDNRPENLELWSNSHPSGQRITDMVAWAREILDRYAAEAELLT